MQALTQLPNGKNISRATSRKFATEAEAMAYLTQETVAGRIAVLGG
jgi:hypothetical protein